MSSLKNAMKSQKTHRERHQPEARQQLGLLEKKKDYRLRAKDYNQKRDTLKRLRKQALDKNPDEFYHHMINSQLVDGVHRESAKDEELTPEQVKLMQTRDLAYVVHKRTAEMRKIERLRANLHLLGMEREDAEGEEEAPRMSNTHTFFVDSEEEKRRFDPAARLRTHPKLLGRTFNRPRMEDLESGRFSTSSLAEGASEEARKRRAKAYKELRQRMERERQLGVVQEKMEVRRHLQNKSGQKPVEVVSKETKDSAPVLRWPTERKK